MDCGLHPLGYYYELFEENKEVIELDEITKE